MRKKEDRFPLDDPRLINKLDAYDRRTEKDLCIAGEIQAEIRANREKFYKTSQNTEIRESRICK